MALRMDLSRLQEIYLKVVEASPDAMVVIDSQGLIVLFNTQAELLFGYERSEVLGTTIEVLVPEALREAHLRHRLHYFDDPRTREMGADQLLQGRHRNGHLLLVQIKLAPLIISGQGVHALAVIRRVVAPDGA